MGKKQYSIADKNAKLTKQGKLRYGVDNYKNESEPEDRRFTIGYENYNESLCDVKVLQKSPLRKIIDNCKKFCKCTSVLELREKGIEINDVIEANHYKQYFAGLSPDVELKEFNAGEQERAFFYIDPHHKVVQMVAFRNAHTETKKNKR